MQIKHYFFSAIQKILEFLGRILKKKANIYMFHQVNDDLSIWSDKNVSITRKGFIEFIDNLLINNYSFQDLNDLPNCLECKSVFITFDDIFADAVKNAIPYLLKKQIPFCIFVTENYIGKKPYLSERQLEMLLKEPLCTIGYHTKSHVLMRNTPKKKIYDEINCLTFAEKYGCIPELFAFPYGSVYACNFFSIFEARRQGYKYCFSTVAFPITKRVTKWAGGFLPRININESNYRKYIE